MVYFLEIIKKNGWDTGSQPDNNLSKYTYAKCSEGDNPTIGIVLCSDTDEDIAKYSILHGNEQLFASKYKLYLQQRKN